MAKSPAVQKLSKIKLSFALAAVILLLLSAAGCAEKKDYYVSSIEDVSYAGVRQYNWHVVVRKPFSVEQMQELAYKLVEEAKQQDPFNALAIMFYDYEEYIGYGYTLGVANYAPGGDLLRAGDVSAGDYETMSFEWILLEKDWSHMLSPREVKIWTAWIDAFFAELTPGSFPERADITSKVAAALKLEWEEVNRILAKQEMWSMQDLSKEQRVVHISSGNEYIIFNLFSKGEMEREIDRILELLPEINWMEYDYVSGGGTFEFLQWLTALKLEEEQQIISVLKATHGLDGAWAEQYSVLVGELFRNDMLKFMECLGVLEDNQLSLITRYVAYNCSYHDLDDIINAVKEIVLKRDIGLKLKLSSVRPAGPNIEVVIEELLRALIAFQFTDEDPPVNISIYDKD